MLVLLWWDNQAEKATPSPCHPHPWEGWGRWKEKQLCFQLGKHGWLPIETLSLYFRELPKSLEGNNVFPFLPSWATEMGGKGRTVSSWVEAGFAASELLFFRRFCGGGLQLLACLSFWNSSPMWFRSGNFLNPWKFSSGISEYHSQTYLPKWELCLRPMEVRAVCTLENNPDQPLLHLGDYDCSF